MFASFKLLYIKPEIEKDLRKKREKHWNGASLGCPEYFGD